jgi:hypothetical protein
MSQDLLSEIKGLAPEGLDTTALAEALVRVVAPAVADAVHLLHRTVTDDSLPMRERVTASKALITQFSLKNALSSLGAVSGSSLAARSRSDLLRVLDQVEAALASKAAPIAPPADWLD